jgi:hypothetical protein
MHNLVKRKFFLWILPALFAIIAAVPGPAMADEISYDSHGKRDPFMPLITLTSKDSTGLMGVETVDELSLEGLVYDPKNGSIIVINGSVLKEGDEVSGVKVIKIKADGATLSLNGLETFKPMYQDDSKGNNQ